MTKKFDVVIGNPPYQDEAVREGGRDEPLYHLFMDAAYEVGRQAVIITPARFLSNAGQTPKRWNRKMLSDEHLRVAHYEQDSKQIFPGLATPIRGGIVVTHRDAERVLGPIRIFIQHVEMRSILQKVTSSGDASLITVMSSGVPNSYSQKMHEDHPEAAAMMGSTDKLSIRTAAFAELPFIFHEVAPESGQAYVEFIGLADKRRARRFILRDYIAINKVLDKWKVAVPAANGSGHFGEVLSSPIVLAPNTAVTQTFLTIGTFKSEAEAEACLKFVKTKFARALLGVLKTTQHNTRGTWKHVPLQDFTADSDIDWTQTIPEIDQQLYEKYGLSGEEIGFIETHVKPMD